ncbi:hypothetical protein ACR9E3_17965 [Actinomycetospora sp. C-140]
MTIGGDGGRRGHSGGEETAVAGRFEIRVSGRLSDRARAAFPGLAVEEVPAETVLTGWSQDDDDVHGVLDRIQSLGLELVSLRQTRDPDDG